MQECKVREGEKGKLRKTFSDEGYELICGPCNGDTKRPSAGVGCASLKDKLELVTPKYLTKAFEEAWKTGRAEKYLVDVGWET